MDDRPFSSTSAGGVLLAVSIMVGAIAGIALHQPSAGLVIGSVAGALIAAGLWLRDRRKR